MEPLFQHQKDREKSHTQEATEGRSLRRHLVLPPKTLKFALYGLLVALASTWAVVGLNMFWGNKTPQIQSQNTARLQTIASDIEQLPLPASIGYGKTSSSLPAVVSKYDAERQSIQELRPVQFTFLNSYPSASAKNDVTNKANVSLDAVDSTLKNSGEALSISAKLLQYDPETDLQPYVAGTEKDASERLVRTDQGIKDVVRAINASSLPYKAKLSAEAQKLVGQAPNVSRQSVPAWSAKVHEVQRAILQTIQDNTASTLQSNATKLRALSGQY